MPADFNMSNTYDGAKNRSYYKLCHGVCIAKDGEMEKSTLIDNDELMESMR